MKTENEYLLREYFESVVDEIVANRPVFDMLAEQIRKKRKNKIMINGIGGNWSNVNIQIKQGKDNWRHFSINHK